ncbi:transporter substrate-binding domain-containing protein [Desulfitobacterium hafniense]|uniref:transporter substrate-binding domain-containing protein n=1 Tax=Desulfitobacterium hafniense TaxID=49338 RepID=UPI00035F8A29|nr:transporter substrate-binding domain-containing protein [Desulfitobacterium hafniense]
MKRKLSLVMAGLLSVMLLATGCGSSGQGDAQAPAGGNEGNNTFKVGLEAGYAPFNWTQMDGANGGVKIDGGAEYAGGYDVEIAKKIAEGLGKELVIVKTEWDGLVPALTSGKIDAIIAGMSPTEERKATIDFSDIYYQSDLVIVVKNGSKYENATSLKDFSGAKITAQLNTFHYGVIDQIEGVDKQTAMDNFPAMRVAVQSGMIDGYVSERPEGVSAQAANSDFKMVELTDGFQTSSDDTAIAVGVKKGSELTAKINEILKEIPEAERLQIMDDAIKNQPAAN